MQLMMYTVYNAVGISLNANEKIHAYCAVQVFNIT